MLEHWQFGTKDHQVVFLRRNFRQPSVRLARLWTDRRAYLRQYLHSKICSFWPSSTAIARQIGSCLIVPRQRLRAPWRRPHRSCGKLSNSACHRVDHPPCAHHRSSEWRRPHPKGVCTALQSRLDISAAPLSSVPTVSSGPDTVSDTLTGQGVVPPNASRSRGAGGTGTGAARGDPGEVRDRAAGS